MDCTIYGLFDPRSGECRYIGSGVIPEQRWKAHWSDKAAIRVLEWCEELRAAGLCFKPVKLAQVASHMRSAYEAAAIKYYAQTCRLLNTNAPPPDHPYQIVVTERVLVPEPYEIVRVERVQIPVPVAPEPPFVAVSKTAMAHIQTWARSAECEPHHIVDEIVQDVLEYEALRGMMFEDANPEQAEDWDLEETGDREPEPLELSDTETEGEELEGEELEGDEWVLKPIDHYRIDSRVPGFQVDI